MICAYCNAVIPDGAEVCPECGKPVDETGLGGTLKFFDMKSSVRVTGIECLIIPVLVNLFYLPSNQDYERASLSKGSRVTILHKTENGKYEFVCPSGYGEADKSSLLIKQ